MALETLIVKTRNESFHTEMREEILSRYPKMNWYIMATSCLKREELIRRYGKQKVLNPFKCLGDFECDLIWIEDWPSLMGERFSELHYLLFSSCKVLILGQCYCAPSWAWKKLNEFCPKVTTLVDDRVPSLPLVPNCPRILTKIKWSERVLWDKHNVYIDPEVDFFVGLDIRVHSYFMNYAFSHYMVGMNSSGLSRADWCSMVKVLVTYLWIQLRLHWNSLVDYHYEYQNRGNSHKKGSLSRSTHYWNTLTSKWKESCRSILWWARRWQEAEVEHS